MAPACTGVGVESRAAMSRSFNEGDIDRSESFAFCFLAGQSWRSVLADLRASAATLSASSFLNYAENERKKRRAGILR